MKFVILKPLTTKNTVYIDDMAQKLGWTLYVS